METTLTDNDAVYYVVRFNNANITQPVTSRMLAEADLAKLPEKTREHARVVPVTAEGKEILFG